MTQLPRPVRAVLAVVDALEACDVDYALSGSFAAAYHGHVRATADADLKVQLPGPSALEDAFERLPTGTRRVDDLTWEVEPGFVVELYPVVDRLDEASMRTRVRGPVFPAVDREVWIVTLEALLVNKLREHLVYPADAKHVSDIRALLALNHDRLDVDELERLLALDPAWPDAWRAHVEPP